MRQAAEKQANTEALSETALLSGAECARLWGVRRGESSAELNEQIGLLLWRLQGTLSRQERREGYQRLEVLLCRKYAGGGDTGRDGEITVVDVDHILHGGNAAR